MSFKINIGTNSRVFYALNGGDDNEIGTSLETAKATIQATVDSVNALVPPVNVLNRAAIFISGSGIFLENIVFPEFTNYHAKDITNTVSSGNLYTLNNISTYEVGLSSVSTASGIVFDIANLTNVSVSCSDATIIGASGRAVSVTGTSNNIFISINQLRVVGDNSIGIDHKGTNGEPEIFIIGDATLEGDTVTCFLHDPTNASARSVLEVASINEFGTANNTTGIQVIDGHLSVFCNEIIATTALDVDGGILSYIGTCITGNINVAVGATLNCEIAEFSGVITNNGTITGRIGTQFFGAGLVTTSDTLTNDVIVRGNGGVDVDAAAHLTVPNNELNLQILLATDTGIISIKDAGSVERIAISFNGTSGIATFSTPGGSVFDCGDGDSQAFQTWTSIGAVNGAAFNWFVGDRNPEGNIVALQSFYLRGNAANTNFYIKKNAIVDSAGWVPVITGPNTATVANKLMLWGDVDGSTALDNTIISYTTGINNFLDFNNDDLNEISGFRWFTSSSGPGPTISFFEGTSQFAFTSLGEILLFSPGITFDNRSLTLPTITRSLAASTVELFQWVRTGSNPADISVFIASIAPSGGGDGDLAIRQDTVNTDLFINVNGVWTGLLASSASETLAQTLAQGNVTGGTDLSISNADSIISVGGETTGTVINLNNLDALTSGGALSIISNSPSTVARTLAQIINDDPLAINTTLLRLRNDAVTGLEVPALDVIGRASFDTGSLGTAQIGYSINCPATTASTTVFSVDANTAINNGTTVSSITQSHVVPTGTIALSVQNSAPDAAARSIISSGSNEYTSTIDSGNANLFNVNGLTTGTGLSVTADGLTTGTAINVVSNSASAGARDLVNIVNDDSNAVNTTLLRLRNDAIGAGNANALDVVGRSFFNTGSLSVGDIGFGIVCVSTTGAAFVFQVDTDASIDDGTTVASITQSQAGSAGTVALSVSNASTDAASRAISAAGINQFTSVLTTGNGSFFDNDSITSGTGVRIRADSLGTGEALVVLSASVTANARNIVDIINDEVAATGAINLHLQQDSTNALLQLERSGATVSLYADNASAQGVITGNPGDVNFLANSLNSNLEVNFGVTVNNDSWGSCLGGPAIIMFGAGGIAQTTTTRFLYPGFGNVTAQTTAIAIRMPRSGFIRGLYIQHNVAAGNGNDIVYTVRINGVASALSVTIPSTTTSASDITNTVEITFNDTVDLEVTKALAIGSSPDDIIATFEYI